MFQGAGLFLENNDKMTPCEMAVKSGHHEVASLLEMRMVFVSLFLVEKKVAFFKFSLISFRKSEKEEEERQFYVVLLNFFFFKYPT